MKFKIGCTLMGIGVLMTLGVFLFTVLGMSAQFGGTGSLPLGVIGIGFVVLVVGVFLTVSSTKTKE